MTFKEFFRKATDGRDPYPFQERFASEENIRYLLRAPTGAGKTATAVLGWLWRWQTKMPNTPRRLVYCLPMRVLVEQSEREAKIWIQNLGLDIPVHILMGGVETEEWYLHPEKPAILIGTQDMLLSRALNRGYAATRFHWPIDFGLLNNDCLWVFDEPQLMANGVSTSAQLAGLRSALGTFGTCPSVWMSATLEPSWLDTVDFRGNFPAAPLELTEADYNPKLPLHKRMTASKRLRKLEAKSSKDMKDVAKAVLAKHKPGTQTLVILNIVDRAKAVYAALDAAIRKEKRKELTLLLIHSRFRPYERVGEKDKDGNVIRIGLNDRLQDKDIAAKDRIIVATQVVEAGVDISSQTLITELAPWASLVQRIGRCNRTGDDGSADAPAQVFWIDLEEKQSPPYEHEELEFASEQLNKLDGQDVSPKALDDFKFRERINLPFEHKHVLRRRDLLDLFDTAPDLSGNDIDIQRFVRSDDADTDVQVYWRNWSGDNPPQDEPSPERRELCSVPVGQIKAFLNKDKTQGFVWDHIDEEWHRIRNPDREIRPGLAILLPGAVGGYSELGWDAESKATVTAIPPAEQILEEGAGSDSNSANGVELTIPQHTRNVCEEFGSLQLALEHLVGDWTKHLTTAARWHDVGKGHRAFQKGMRNANPNLDAAMLWAKSGTNHRLRHGRKYFRHELVSALAALQQQLPFEVVYVIAAHHGRVRLAIRSLPHECEPSAPNILFALGVHDGDDLPEINLDGATSSALKIDLSPMRLGGDKSWTANALKLLGEIGPFKLAYLETLLRAADVRASQKEASRA